MASFPAKIHSYILRSLFKFLDLLFVSNLCFVEDRIGQGLKERGIVFANLVSCFDTPSKCKYGSIFPKQYYLASVFYCHVLQNLPTSHFAGSMQ